MVKKAWVYGISLFMLLSLQSCETMRIPTIYDGQIYGVKHITVPGRKIHLRKSETQLPIEKDWIPEKYLKRYGSVDEMMTKTNTTAFLVMKNGAVIYEKYYNGITKGELTQIFSVSKTITTTMLGVALQEGKIKSLNQKVCEFIPSFKKPGLNEITLLHLAQMRSGLNYDEYKKIFQTLKFYHTKNLNKAVSNPELKYKPGTKFTYKSIDNQLLGMCISKAVGMPFTEYVNKKLFSKIGIEDSIEWSVDSKENKQPKFYGGLNISARDLAKFGQLIANDGVINGKIILGNMTNTFCTDTTRRNGEDEYCNGWWYNEWSDDADVFFGAGFKGQILMIDKTDDVVIVRLGKNKGGIKWYEMLKNLCTQIPGQKDIGDNGLATKDK